MKILISSGHYFVSDKYGTEPIWPIKIAQLYREFGHEVIMICGVLDVLKNLSQNIKVYKMRNCRSNNIVIESLFRFFYPIYSLIISIVVCFRHNKEIRLVHHIAPTSSMSYDLFFILRNLIKTKAKYIWGPMMPPATKGGLTDFVSSSGTSKNIFAKLIWKIIIFTNPVFHQLFINTLRKSDKIICATKEAKDYYSAYLISEKYDIVPIGVDLNLAKKSKIITNKRINLLCVQYLNKRKSVDTILLALKNLIDKSNLFRLSIVGDGEERIVLQHIVDKLKLNKYVTFHGFIEHSQISKYYKNADIFISATREEPYGMTLLEAMANGLPIIVSDVNSTKTLIGKAGTTFQPGNAIDLAVKIEQIVNNQSLYSKCSKAGLENVKSDYYWPNIIKKYLSIIR